MKNIGVLRRHIPTGAIIWFPSGYTFSFETGIVMTDTPPYRIGFAYRHWDYNDLEDTDHEIEINLIHKP
jgi:hypothetical protein